jgi:UDP-N-acetylglucosamine 2-epimerase (non-hydrolysing)
MKRKIAVVVGTRPEAIKLAPVVLSAREQPDLFDVTVIATGQHRDLLAQALAEFNIAPDVDLDLMEHDQTLTHITKAALEGLTRVFSAAAPACVIVQGDTTTSFVGALAAFYHRIDVAHVEAGLRTGDRYQPFPEEMNRSLLGRLATHHFAPTTSAKDNLLAEGIAATSIWVTGNTAIDALLRTQQILGASEAPGARGRVLLLTVHRRENHGPRLDAVLSAVERLLDGFDDLHVICPVHPNPNVEAIVRSRLGARDRVEVCKALGYREFVRAMMRADVILTDSGGVQEEAPSLHKPVLVLRDKTERIESIEAGVSRLVGTATESIVNAVTELLTHAGSYRAMASGKNPYGDGTAAQRILSVLAK